MHTIKTNKQPLKCIKILSYCVYNVVFMVAITSICILRSVVTLVWLYLDHQYGFPYGRKGHSKLI